jgi:short-subunit dehydrogenase
LYRKETSRMDLAGKHVVITGGSRGIGAAMAGAFAAADARVSLVARDERLLRQVAERVGAAWLVADVTDPGGLIERAQRTAPIDILINNAGLDHTGAFTELSAQRLGELYAVNALAPAELSRQVLPTMLSRGSGQIVFISSLSATVSLPGLTAYSASKAAVSQLVPGLRAELRGSGVQIILAEIGPVVTGMYDAVRSHPTAARARPAPGDPDHATAQRERSRRRHCRRLPPSAPQHRATTPRPTPDRPDPPASTRRQPAHSFSSMTPPPGSGGRRWWTRTRLTTATRPIPCWPRVDETSRASSVGRSTRVSR